jgi:two-component system response regulator AtoC
MNGPGHTPTNETFTVLFCGSKAMMQEVRKFLPPAKDLLLRFTSSPDFLGGRSVFHPPSVVLLDVSGNSAQPNRSVLKEFTASFPALSVVALSNEQDLGLAVDLVKAGVAAFFCLPRDRKRVEDFLAQAKNQWRAMQRRTEFVELQRKVYDFSHIIGTADSLRRTIDRAHKVIVSNAMTVLITGETGTGKELLARAIHFNSVTKHHPFVDIACSALPENLLESELFGYEKGAFTDAKDRKIGLFEMAGEGTIFLDEIGDISLAIQSKLLKVIEDRVMRRIGGVRDIPVRARIVAATSADLGRKMKSGEFRKDLFHRLKILPLEMPPIRERREDIPLLVEAFLKQFNAEYGKRIQGVTTEALRQVMEQEWEGNVRELKHAIERAVLLEDLEWITEADFEFRQDHRGNQPRTAPQRDRSGREDDGPAFMISVPRGRATIANVQLLLARRVLEETRGNKVAAARVLGVSRPRLDRILRQGDDEGE